MRSSWGNHVLLVTSLVTGLIGLALLAGGGWLILLGGSWYYGIAGLGFLVAAALLAKARTAALWAYAVVVIGTLAWAVWEVGLDWWRLAPRGGVIFVLGLWLLSPWVSRAIDRRRPPAILPATDKPNPFRSSRVVLSAALLVAISIGAVAWFVDPRKVRGEVPAESAGTLPDGSRDIPAGEWHAYGRTGSGQRYSPLTQITPRNVAGLELAWTYRTGDIRGRPGDPEETTFEVTPLKIANRLFLCTPHQSVVALDATTGRELWRFDPEILDKLALQHLTCRGLSYYPGPAAGAPMLQTDAPEPPAAAKLDLPVAATGNRTVDCTAELFMPTADGRLIALRPEDGAVCSNFGNGTGQISLWANMPNVKPGVYY
ncbi:MAG: membrane-bound PQQ-dependent dehydrogenase, glucose/quinate/shikimate family, partial [Parvibaculaceae bacterium]